MRKAVYWCAGGLLCLNFLPHGLPSFPSHRCPLERNILLSIIIRFSLQLSLGWTGNDSPPELMEHVRKIAHVMVRLYTNYICIPYEELTQLMNCLIQGLPHPERINVFLSKGLTSMAFGSPWLPRGAAIGLPRFVRDWPTLECMACLPMGWLISLALGQFCSGMKRM